nr:MAG TPA: hypothetical protein [Caudoviricetes sp.]
MSKVIYSSIHFTLFNPNRLKSIRLIVQYTD